MKYKVIVKNKDKPDHYAYFYHNKKLVKRIAFKNILEVMSTTRMLDLSLVKIYKGNYSFEVYGWSDLAKEYQAKAKLKTLKNALPASPTIAQKCPFYRLRGIPTCPNPAITRQNAHFEPFTGIINASQCAK